MPEEAFAWFKKRKINPPQSPADFFNLPDLEWSDLGVLIENWADQESYTLRTLFPGTYKADDLTLMINDQLPSHVFDAVLGHEYVHALLSQHVYGQVVLGLELFAIAVAAPLMLIRQFVIMEMFKEFLREGQQGTHYKSKRSQAQLEFEFFKRVARDELMSQRIRERLASDQIFMRGLRFLDDLDKRKNLLLRSWKRAQEGGAYWLGLSICI